MRERASAKFDETVEIARISASIPSTPTRWCAAWSICRTAPAAPCGSRFSPGAKADEAKAAGADVVGAEDLVTERPGRNDRIRPLHRHPGHDAARRPPRQGSGPARPDAQSQGRHRDDGRHRGGSGLQGRRGRVPRRKGRHRAGSVGKASFDDGKLVENITAFVDAVVKAKPTGAKGTYMQRVALTSTMGPGVKVDPASITVAHH